MRQLRIVIASLAVLDAAIVLVILIHVREQFRTLAFGTAFAAIRPYYQSLFALALLLTAALLLCRYHRGFAGAAAMALAGTLLLSGARTVLQLGGPLTGTGFLMAGAGLVSIIGGMAPLASLHLRRHTQARHNR